MGTTTRRRRTTTTTTTTAVASFRPWLANGEEGFPVMRLVSRVDLASWRRRRAERPVPLASQKSTLDNTTRYGWSNLSTVAASEREKNCGTDRWETGVSMPCGPRRDSRRTRRRIRVHMRHHNSYALFFNLNKFERCFLIQIMRLFDWIYF